MQNGQKILINGAGGGVGTFAIQLAKSVGAEVTGVDHTNKLDLILSVGADQVIDYTKVDFTKNEERYDLILDVVGNRSIFDIKRASSSNGTYVMVGGSTATIFQVMFLGPLIARTEGKKLGLLLHKPNHSDQQLMKELFETRKVVPIIDRCYPLSEVAEAFRYYGGGNAKGKVVISMGLKTNL